MEYKYKVLELANKSKELEDALNECGRRHYKLSNIYIEDGFAQVIVEKETEE